MLAKHDVKATFFTIGEYAEQQPALLREVAAAGHAIGNHTYSHVSMPLHTDETIRRELRMTTEAIEDAGVEMAQGAGQAADAPAVRAPPAGHAARAARGGLRAVIWSVTLWDWSKRVTTEKIMRKAERQIKGGDVILLHDGCNEAMGWDRSHSVEATELILTQWKQQQGNEFVTVPEMIEATGFEVP